MSTTEICLHHSSQLVKCPQFNTELDRIECTFVFPVALCSMPITEEEVHLLMSALVAHWRLDIQSFHSHYMTCKYKMRACTNKYPFQQPLSGSH